MCQLVALLWIREISKHTQDDVGIESGYLLPEGEGVMEPKNGKKILYVRSAPYVLSFDSYNLQEVGLGKAFCQKGYDFDLLYYAKENKDQVIKVGENRLAILWRKGIKILRTGIYPCILSREFLNQYDIVIMSEYSQIMSVLVSYMHPNVYLYNGPYYNLFKIPFMQLPYDVLFCKGINKRMKKVFCKTNMAKEFIGKKGITNCSVVGVGLDTEKFDNELTAELETQQLIQQMQGHRNILYVGSISKRKNVELTIRAFSELKKMPGMQDVQLVIVGKGGDEYVSYCKKLIPQELEPAVIWCSFIKNAQMKFIYEAAQLFVLPSTQEIFGMVLLEAMYFGNPIVASHSAGAETLIVPDETGVIIDSFDIAEWTEAMSKILSDEKRQAKMGKAMRNRVVQDFSWNAIAEKMQSVFGEE